MNTWAETKHFGLVATEKKRHITCPSPEETTLTTKNFPLPNQAWTIQLDPNPNTRSHHRHYDCSQKRFSNSLNSFGLISSLLMPSTSYSTPLRA